MHPSYRSDEPGIAPDCGMELEPVYAGSQAPEASPVAGGVRISADRQQLIGVQVETIEKRPLPHTLRLLGRVAVNETRIFRINATVDGWITQTYPNATGSIVKKNEVLAGFYSPDFLSAQQAYIHALSSQDRVSQGTSAGREAQLQQFTINLRQYRDALMNLGMGPVQIEEITRSRQYAETIDIASPADGIILARGVSQGQRFEKGTELYRIADLNTVWVLADVFESDAAILHPGAVARVHVPGRSRIYPARVSDAVPQFDPVSRTLKLRLEAGNPGLLLKPDMFVDVELDVSRQPALLAPVDAVLDTGMRKTVFVERGKGIFEPRQVDTGLRANGMVEITAGLEPGERIVVSGAFLVDSETRMKAPSSTGRALDPVCGHEVDRDKARAAGRTSTTGGMVQYFCSRDCKTAFERKHAASAPPAPVKSISAPALRNHGHD
jgi:Cu(I)/Ag(I) efflux system membrane fusion protein